MKVLHLDLDITRHPVSLQDASSSRQKKRINKGRQAVIVPSAAPRCLRSASEPVEETGLPSMQVKDDETPDVGASKSAPGSQTVPTRLRPLLRKRPVDSLLPPEPDFGHADRLNRDEVKTKDVIELVDIAFRCMAASDPKHVPRNIKTHRAETTVPLEAIAPGLWSPGYLPVRPLVPCLI